MNEVKVRNPITEECDRVPVARLDALRDISARGVLASRALEILAIAPEAEEYVEKLKELRLL